MQRMKFGEWFGAASWLTGVLFGGGTIVGCASSEVVDGSSDEGKNGSIWSFDSEVQRQGEAKRLGSIQIMQLMDWFPSMWARFAPLDGPSSEGDSDQSVEVVGPCTLTTGPLQDASEGPSHRAGEITVTTDDEFSAVGQFNSFSGIYDFEDEGTLRGAEKVTIVAEGETLPAFSAEINMPLAPFLILPAGPSGDSQEGEEPSDEGLQTSDEPPHVKPNIEVPRDEDLQLKWDARDSAESFYAFFSAEVEGGYRTTAFCHYDAKVGEGQISEEVLSLFPAGTDLILFSANTNKVVLDEGEVQVVSMFAPVDVERRGRPKLILKE